jgi:hypothetical protein
MIAPARAQYKIPPEWLYARRARHLPPDNLERVFGDLIFYQPDGIGSIAVTRKAGRACVSIPVRA